MSGKKKFILIGSLLTAAAIIIAVMITVVVVVLKNRTPTPLILIRFERKESSLWNKRI